MTSSKTRRSSTSSSSMWDRFEEEADELLFHSLPSSCTRMVGKTRCMCSCGISCSSASEDTDRRLRAGCRYHGHHHHEELLVSLFPERRIRSILKASGCRRRLFCCLQTLAKRRTIAAAAQRCGALSKNRLLFWRGIKKENPAPQPKDEPTFNRWVPATRFKAFVPTGANPCIPA